MHFYLIIRRQLFLTATLRWLAPYTVFNFTQEIILNLLPVFAYSFLSLTYKYTSIFLVINKYTSVLFFLIILLFRYF